MFQLVLVCAVFKGIKGEGILHVGASIVVTGARDRGFVKRENVFLWDLWENILVVYGGTEMEADVVEKGDGGAGYGADTRRKANGKGIYQERKGAFMGFMWGRCLRWRTI